MDTKTDEGESTAKWAIRQPGFLASSKQLYCCARCGSVLPFGKDVKRKVSNLGKPNMHCICDECFNQIPD